MNYDKLEFVETVEELAAMHNLEVPFEAGSGPSQIERHQRQTLYQLMDSINSFTNNLYSNLLPRLRASIWKNAD